MAASSDASAGTRIGGNRRLQLRGLDDFVDETHRQGLCRSDELSGVEEPECCRTTSRRASA